MSSSGSGDLSAPFLARGVSNGGSSTSSSGGSSTNSDVGGTMRWRSWTNSHQTKAHKRIAVEVETLADFSENGASIPTSMSSPRLYTEGASSKFDRNGASGSKMHIRHHKSLSDPDVATTAMSALRKSLKSLTGGFDHHEKKEDPESDYYIDDVEWTGRDRSRQMRGRASSQSKLIRSQPLLQKRFSCSSKCRIYTSMVLAGAIAVLILVLGFSRTYGALHAADPCMVAVSAKQVLSSVSTPVTIPTHDLPKEIKELRMPRNRGEFPGEKIEFPKIIHQQWKTKDIPEGTLFADFHAKWKELYPSPEYTHILWTDENGRELIKNHYPFFLEKYDSYRFGIQRADAVRYFALHFYGGLYADMDYEPLVNFWDYIPKDRVGLVESPYQYNEKVQNSLMSSPKGDPFWNVTFDYLAKFHDKPVLHATGPMFLDSVLSHTKYPSYALPCENFQRLPYNERKNSPFLSQFHREFLGRLYPMKNCGVFQEKTCQFARHHNTATYLKDTGLVNLLWT